MQTIGRAPSFSSFAKKIHQRGEPIRDELSMNFHRAAKYFAEFRGILDASYRKMGSSRKIFLAMAIARSDVLLTSHDWG
jgi:hypothetical protein